MGLGKNPDKYETDSRIDKHYRNHVLRCDRCPPNRGCNGTNFAKHGKGKPKYKDHRS